MTKNGKLQTAKGRQVLIVGHHSQCFSLIATCSPESSLFFSTEIQLVCLAECWHSRDSGQLCLLGGLRRNDHSAHSAIYTQHDCCTNLLAGREVCAWITTAAECRLVVSNWADEENMGTVLNVHDVERATANEPTSMCSTWTVTSVVADAAVDEAGCAPPHRRLMGVRWLLAYLINDVARRHSSLHPIPMVLLLVQTYTQSFRRLGYDTVKPKLILVKMATLFTAQLNTKFP